MPQFFSSLFWFTLLMFLFVPKLKAVALLDGIGKLTLFAWNIQK